MTPPSGISAKLQPPCATALEMIAAPTAMRKNLPGVDAMKTRIDLVNEFSFMFAEYAQLEQKRVN